jgi:hypothetical protein
MRVHVRVSLVALLVSASVAVAAPAAQAAVPFGIEQIFAANCKVSTCGEFPEYGGTPLKNSELFTQAAGHPPAGITAFKVNTEGVFPNEVPAGIATGGIVSHVRTDVGVGVATSPEAVGKCSKKEFDASEKEEEAIPGTGFYPAPKCAETGSGDTVIGVNKVVVYAGHEALGPGVSDLPVEGTTYNLEQPQKRASDFGVALKLPIAFTKGALEKAFAEKGNPLGKPTEEFLEAQQYYAHTLIEGGVEWGAESAGTGKADYHDYYEIEVSPTLPLISSRLILEGTRGTTGKGGFITNPSSCSGVGPQTTTTITVTPKEGAPAQRGYSGPLGTEGCNGAPPFEAVPFAPAFNLSPEKTQSDLPDGITTELSLPHNPGPEEIDSSQLKTASFTLPEGMTLNPSAANGLEACSPSQARIHSSTFGVACPGKSKIGEVTLNVPTLPAGSLTGNVYLGGPESGPITAPPFTVYINAESTRYNVDVRLKGTVTPNETTGRLTATFTENPEQPFSNIALRFNGGATAPIANPLACGTAKTETSLSPFTGTAAQSPTSSFTVDSNGSGGSCSSPLPFTLSQSTQNASSVPGANTSYTLNLGRNEGQQYLSQVKTVLPAGLVGLIPTVPLCGEAEANAGTCSVGSQIGSVTVSAGSGSSPYTFYGQAYLTGPYNGAPYGMSIVVPAAAGPFNLGLVVTRASIAVEPYTARVVVTSSIPTIVKGVPLRLRGISIAINRPGFMRNPTNCAVLASESTLSGFTTLGVAGTATQSLSSPFQVAGCTGLAFKPSFGAATGAKTSKANGASLETTLNVPAGQSNVKSVLVQLPKQLPSRLTTLQKACPEATFAANPYSCPGGSFVGGVRANTPVLSAKLKGPAILVSHGGQAFPDLDLLLEGDGVRVILVGNTNIKGGITTTNFAATPDVPVTSITVNLPIGGHSALTADGNVCANKLLMPTTIVGQNGTSFKQSTTIKITNCPVRVVGQKVVGNTAYITVQTFSAGRISGKGSNLATVFRGLGRAQKTATLKVSLSSAGRGRRRPLRVKLRVGFVPKKKGTPSSAAFTTVTFR